MNEEEYCFNAPIVMMNETISLMNIATHYSYQEFKDLTVQLAEDSNTTGEKTEKHIEATKINAQRLKRIDKQCHLNPKLTEVIQNFKLDCLWIVLAESWCGDGAQIIPVIAKIADASKTIELQIVLRDVYPEIMDSYLTNGARAIPKLICINKLTGDVVGSWGPRPLVIRNMVMEYKKMNPDVTHEEFTTNLHLWYARDKTEAIQNEFIDLLNKWNVG